MVNPENYSAELNTENHVLNTVPILLFNFENLAFFKSVTRKYNIWRSRTGKIDLSLIDLLLKWISFIVPFELNTEDVSYLAR